MIDLSLDGLVPGVNRYHVFRISRLLKMAVDKRKRMDDDETDCCNLRRDIDVFLNTWSVPSHSAL